jgi:hypothetical protein
MVVDRLCICMVSTAGFDDSQVGRIGKVRFRVNGDVYLLHLDIYTLEVDILAVGHLAADICTAIKKV